MTTNSASASEERTIFGQPTGLFMLFFAEMWERFSYYGMRALLLLYMIKGFLSYSDENAYAVYGAYGALVYMTPFFGGLIADRLLGARRAVVIGGLLMAAGHLVMGFDPGVIGYFMGMEEAAVAASASLQSGGEMAFFTALALLIVGNGFFKPNISSIVGSLYKDGDPRRDGGFTLFYMGINLGAAAAPLLCGYIGETFGWHYGFGLATIGMLVGLAVFVLPAGVARFLTLGGALLTASSMVLIQDNLLLAGVNGFVALCLAIAGVVAFMAMGRAGLPAEAGGVPNPELLKRGIIGPITLEHLTYAGAVLIVPLLAALVWSNIYVEIVDGDYIKSLTQTGDTVMVLAGTLLKEVSRPAGLILLIIGIGAVGYLIFEAVKAQVVERHRLVVILILMFFSMLFWAFFEQAGSSVNNFTDRNVDRVFEEEQIRPDQVGTEVTLRLSQEQLGYVSPAGKVFTMDQLDALRDASNKGPEGQEPVGMIERLTTALTTPPPIYYALFGGGAEPPADDPLVQTWTIDEAHVGMGIAGSEVPASTFQAANPIFILLFGLPFAGLWVFLGKRRIEPNTSIKFALGLLQLGLGFGALWYGAITATDRGMVWMGWLLLGYLLHTTGELCLSPVGLSMVTRLSPKRLVSTVMGGWFLATAFSAYLAAVIASFTGVGGHGGDDSKDEEDSDGAASAETDGPATPAEAEPPDPVPDATDATDDSDGTSDATDDTDGAAADASDATDDTDGAVADASDATDDTDGAVADASDATDDTDGAVADASDATDDTDATETVASTEAADPVVAEADAEATSATVEAKEPVPPPIDTVNSYGGVFGTIAIAAMASAVILGAISPLLQKWMHEDLLGPDSEGDGH